MPWIDFETGKPFSDQELEAMKGVAPEHQPDAASPVTGHDVPTEERSAVQDFGSGIEASLMRTYLGLKQLATYVGGDEQARASVNAEIDRMEQEHGPALETLSGKAGNIAGVVGQFAVPGMAAAKVAKMFPAAATAIQGVLGAPGSIGRAGVTGAAFEAAQPVQPGTSSGQDFAVQKAGKTLLGGATGLAAGAIANKLTRAATPVKPALQGIDQQAKALGFVDDAALTPAQRTGDIGLLQKEEGLLASPGSSNVIRKVRDAQQAVLDKTSARAIGQPGQAPNEAALSLAREAAAKGYQPIASIPKMLPDLKYQDALTAFAKKQAIKATGSKDAADVAKRLHAGSGKMTGDGFVEELQGVRDMAFDATRNGQSATSKQLRELSSIMEDFAERRVEKLSLQGVLPKNAMDQFRQARTDMAKIHAIEKAVDPVTGKMSATKYLNQEFKRQPARSGRGTSPTSQGLREVGDIARILRQTGPYIGSSGTAERMMGQKMIEMETSPAGALRSAIPTIRNYLAAQSYLRSGGKPGLLPGNMLARRLLPAGALGTGEAMQE